MQAVVNKMAGKKKDGDSSSQRQGRKEEIKKSAEVLSGLPNEHA